MMKVCVFVFAICFLFAGSANAICENLLANSSSSNFSDVATAPTLYANESNVAKGGQVVLVIRSFLYFKNITIEFDAEINKSGNHSQICDHFLNQASQNWTETLEGDGNCTVKFTARFKIVPILHQCFHFVQTTTDFDIYETNIRMTSVLARTGGRGESIDRTYITAQKLKIRFPRNINVTLDPTTEGKNLTAFGYNQIFGDVILQQFEQDTAQTRVLFYTSVNPPYMLNATAQSVSPTNYTITPLALSSASPYYTSRTFPCANDNTSICYELWEVIIRNPDACKIEATITLNFTVNCRPTFGGGCNASLLTPPTYAVTFKLLSNDFCPQLLNDGVITGSIASYMDAGYTQPQANFLYNQRLYFRISIFPDFGPNIIVTHINYVTVESNNKVVFDPNTGATAAHYIASGFQVADTTPQGYQAQFSFIAGPSSVTFADTDKFQLTNVTASVTVSYETLSENGYQLQSEERKVRFVAQTAQSSTDVSAITSIAYVADASSATASTATVAIAVAAAVGCFIAIAVLVVILRKRRNANKESGEEQPKLLFV